MRRLSPSCLAPLLVAQLVLVLAPMSARAGDANGAATVKAALQPIRDRLHVPAMAAAVVTDKGLQAIDAVGIRKYGEATQVTTNDLWHLGSDTKVMTATVMARFVERGLLRWDTTVSAAFPGLAHSFDPGFTNVTVLHLLSHRAGVEANLNWGKFSKYGTVENQRREVVKEALSREPRSKPGSTFLYSNLGYVIAGAMLERVSGKSWEAVMKVELFQPLGMKSAGFGGLGTPGKLDQPWGHTKTNKPVSGNGPEVDNPPVLGPAGRVHCTLQDWALFVADQLRGLRGEPALLKAESYRRLVTPPFGGDYALGWRVTERDWAGGLALNHCGCNTMLYANAWIAPKRNFAILVCANLGLDAFGATDEAVARLLPLAIAAGKTDADIPPGN